MSLYICLVYCRNTWQALGADARVSRETTIRFYIHSSTLHFIRTCTCTHAHSCSYPVSLLCFSSTMRNLIQTQQSLLRLIYTSCYLCIGKMATSCILVVIWYSRGSTAPCDSVSVTEDTNVASQTAYLCTILDHY